MTILWLENGICIRYGQSHGWTGSASQRTDSEPQDAIHVPMYTFKVRAMSRPQLSKYKCFAYCALPRLCCHSVALPCLCFANQWFAWPCYSLPLPCPRIALFSLTMLWVALPGFAMLCLCLVLCFHSLAMPCLCIALLFCALQRLCFAFAMHCHADLALHCYAFAQYL